MIWLIVDVSFFLLKYVGLIWLINKFTNAICKSKACLVGKVALVTGGNKGIGFETSLGLAARGCKVIIVCRSDAEKERQSIINQTNNPNVIVKRTDLSLMSEVRRLVDDLKKTEKKLDILINNAVLLDHDAEYTPEGLEFNMAASIFAPFLLTCLLTDLLKKSENGRIIFLSSISIWFNNLKIDKLNVIPEKINLINGVQTYGNAKICNLIMSNMFAEKLKPFGITSNAVHPGMVYTSLWTASERVINVYLAKMSYILYKIFYKTAEEGAQLTLMVAMDPYYGKSSGNFVWDYYMPVPPIANNKEVGKQLWEELEKLTKIKPNEKI